MFDLWKLKLEEINRDWTNRTKIKRKNPNIVLTRLERRILNKC